LPRVGVFRNDEAVSKRTPEATASPSCKSGASGFRRMEGGILVNLETKQPFSYKDACVVHGAHVGHDPVATEAATTAVKTFLSRVFKLN
jgi:hypothetical protein